MVPALWAEHCWPARRGSLNGAACHPAPLSAHIGYRGTGTGNHRVGRVTDAIGFLLVPCNGATFPPYFQRPALEWLHPWGKRQFRPQGRDISFIYFANISDIYPEISEKFLRFSLRFVHESLCSQRVTKVTKITTTTTHRV